MKDKTNITNSYAEYRNYLEIKNKADSTIADYCAKALKLINYLIRNNIDTYKLRIDQIESYLAKYKKKSISNNTYAKFVNCTRIFLTQLSIYIHNSRLKQGFLAFFWSLQPLKFKVYLF